MSSAKRLIVYSSSDPDAERLVQATSNWGMDVTTCFSPEDLRGKIEGAPFDYVLCEGSSALKPLFQESSEEGCLSLPLAEVEKRHILRVLAANNGNKTRAAKVLGIDTKTLYNKLKAYQSSEELARKRRSATPGAGIS